MGHWLFNHVMKCGRKRQATSVETQQQLPSGVSERLSSFSIIHPECDAQGMQVYCGRLFVWKDGNDDVMHQERVAILFDGSCDDLDRKSIDFIVGAGYQSGFRVTILLDELREPIPEAFLNAFDEQN